MLGQNCVIDKKNVKSYTYCCYISCAKLIERVGEKTRPQKRRNSLPCTVRIKGLVVCYVKWLRSMIYEMGLGPCSARCVGLVPCFGQDGYQAQVPQHPIDTYRYNKIQSLTILKIKCVNVLNRNFDKF